MLGRWRHAVGAHVLGLQARHPQELLEQARFAVTPGPKCGSLRLVIGGLQPRLELWNHSPQLHALGDPPIAELVQSREAAVGREPSVLVHDLLGIADERRELFYSGLPPRHGLMRLSNLVGAALRIHGGEGFTGADSSKLVCLVRKDRLALEERQPRLLTFRVVALQVFLAA